MAIAVAHIFEEESLKNWRQFVIKRAFNCHCESMLSHLITLRVESSRVAQLYKHSSRDVDV